MDASQEVKPVEVREITPEEQQREYDRQQLHELTTMVATLCTDLRRAAQEIRLAVTDLEHRLEIYARELQEMGDEDG